MFLTKLIEVFVNISEKARQYNKASANSGPSYTLQEFLTSDFIQKIFNSRGILFYSSIVILE
jgi:hypothetical protein